jgi:hypothetical protein
MADGRPVIDESENADISLLVRPPQSMGRHWSLSRSIEADEKGWEGGYACEDDGRLCVSHTRTD